MNSATVKLPAVGSPKQRVRLIDGLVSLLALYVRLRERQHQRRLLVELDDRLLDDIGVTRERAEQVGRKRFWE